MFNQGSWVCVRSGFGRKLLSSRSRFVFKGRKKKAKKQCDENYKRISVARDVHESWKKIKCVFLGHALLSTSFVLGDANKSGVNHFSFNLLNIVF